MSDLVPAEDIERIVGVMRQYHAHYGRAVSSEQVVYILHSKLCLESGIDLRDCPFSVALDQGIDEQRWTGYEDVPVMLDIRHGELVPLVDPDTGRWACCGTDARSKDPFHAAGCPNGHDYRP